MKLVRATALLAMLLALAACRSDADADGDRSADQYDAAAGRPVTCGGRATVADDPSGDVLTYDVGISPRPVAELTPELSGVDVTGASVRLDGATVCAVVTFASPPPAHFELQLSLKDTTTEHCCTALMFRATAEGREVGVPRIHLLDRLLRVADAGAELRGNVLEITGTLDDAEWHPRPPRSPDDLAWRIESRYSPDGVSPAFGDWLPPYRSVAQRYVGHRDGRPVP